MASRTSAHIAYLNSVIPMPTAEEQAEMRAWRERRAKLAEERQAREQERNARMRGRGVSVGGHDGKVMYVTFTRPNGYRRMYRIPLPIYANQRTLRFYRFVLQWTGSIPANIIGWGI